MDRRHFIKRGSHLFLASQMVSLWPKGAYAVECSFTDHLEGFIPEGANAALSSTGQFHHFHYLHVPQSILNDPPEGGWSTITSMMSPELGIDDFFFRRREVRKQFHCHRVYFSHRQLVAIAAGETTEVVAYINRRGEAVRNHTFVFNPVQGEDQEPLSLEEIEDGIRAVAVYNELRMQRSACDTSVHRGVTVFDSKGFQVVNSVEQLESLKGY